MMPDPKKCPALKQLQEEIADHVFHSTKIKERCEYIVKALTKFDPLNIKMIKSIAFYGLPDEIRSLRPLIWRLIFGYLPADKSKWEELLKKNRDIYGSFVQELIERRNQEILALGDDFLKDCDWERFLLEKDLENFEKTEGKSNDKIEPPLEEKRRISAIYSDLSLWDEIEKDTKRTRSEMHFFVSKNDKPPSHPLLVKLNLCLNPRLRVIPQEKSSREKLQQEIDGKSELHNDLLSRVLFIYAKLNPGIKYVQGMNEIAGTIYYCFATDKNEILRANAEVDTFFCFTLIMGEIKDGFIRNLDQAPSGLKGRIQDLNDLLKRINKELWEHLENEKVNPYFYSLRWVMLLLTQEFEMHNILRVWDSLLSHSNKTLYLNYCCVAILVSLKEELIQEDFSGIMEKLQQNINNIDIQSVMGLAYQLYKQFSGMEEVPTFVIL